jgi:hypothetical protein
VDCSHLAQDSRTLVKMVMNVWVHSMSWLIEQISTSEVGLCCTQLVA